MRQSTSALLIALASAGLLSATVVPESELEAHKPQLQSSKSGSNLQLDWAAQPEVFYFVEGSYDLETWMPAKLLKDNAQSGNLQLSTGINPAPEARAFFRLSLEGDPDAARLRADDDGDRIINRLEAEAGHDAFESASDTDSDGDGLADAWEQFHLGTLAHDGSHVATEGSLSLNEAYANATDPQSADSDGDGFSDAYELANNLDPNYNQSRDDPSLLPEADKDGDGLSNAKEALHGTGIDNPDSDNDDEEDGVDGWAHDPNLTHERVSESYVLIDLSTHLPYGAGIGHSVQVDDAGGVLLAYKDSASNSIRNFTTQYYNWSTVLAPTALNGAKPSESSYSDQVALYDATAVLKRNGLLYFAARYQSTPSGSEINLPDAVEDFLEHYNTYIELRKGTTPKDYPIPDLFDFTHHDPESPFVGTMENFNLFVGNINSEEVRASVSAEEIIYLAHSPNPESYKLVRSKRWIDNALYSENVDYIGSENGATPSLSLLAVGAHGTELSRSHQTGGSTQYSVKPASGAPYNSSDALELHSTLDQDVITQSGGAAYSLDNGANFHDFKVWDSDANALVPAVFGNSSDELIVLNGNNHVLINQRQRSIEDLVQNGEGWSNFKLTDINSHGMIVGTAEKAGSQKVVALLKVDIELEKEIACDGETVDIDIIADSSITSLISNVTLRAEKPDESTDFNGLNPDDKGLTFSQRGDDITEWQVDNARWYSTDTKHLNHSSDYNIIAEITLEGQTIEFASVALKTDTSPESSCLSAGYNVPTTTGGLWDGGIDYTISQNSEGFLVTYSGDENFKKNIKGSIFNDADPNSQYYAMLQMEEEFHKLQWQGNGGVGTSEHTTDLFLAENVISELNARSRRIPNEEDIPDAIDRNISESFRSVILGSLALSQLRRCDIEREAKDAINATFRLTMESAYPECSN